MTSQRLFDRGEKYTCPRDLLYSRQRCAVCYAIGQPWARCQFPIADAGGWRTSTVETHDATFHDPEIGPTGNFIVSNNLPEPAEHPVTSAEPRRKQVALIFADIVES